jgi:hypothetical protein
MSSEYKAALNKLVTKKKKEIPTIISEQALINTFEILESTPEELIAIADNISKENFDKPIIPGKRSFRETLIHLLNIEALNYTTIYPAFLLDKANVYPLHAERDIHRLGLFENFTKEELLTVFGYERMKTMNFFKALKSEEWSKQLIEENKQRQETIYWRARGHALHDFTHMLILKFQLDIIE